MNKDHLSRWRANFFTGLAIVLPAIISLLVIFWLFFTISNITDRILVFIPKQITHENSSNGVGTGPMYWYWSVVALLLVVFLISVVGLLARNYLGKKLISSVDMSLLRVPLLNKIYGTTKQVNEAFTSSNKNSFKTVVMVEFPRAGMYSIGFLTSEAHDEVQSKAGEKLMCVFIPTTPNPTSGFLVLVPEAEVTKLEMSVADGVKFIISLGSISPEYPPVAATKVAARS
ncbi:MAG: hypothetical protein JWR69_1413 [Pedosphaera sp.]|nr:hypothetical protein [Pedosphaera sp.]